MHTFDGLGIRSIAFPAIGCGLGGLRWDEVHPLFVHHLASLPIQVFLHPPRFP